MTDVEFVSLFRVEELPECTEGLWLLKQWIESEPGVVDQLRDSQQLDLESMGCNDNLIFLKLLFHTRSCDDCQRLLGSSADPN